MALSPSTAPSLTTFRAIAFDIFGTLIDEPKGLFTALQPLISQLPKDHQAKLSPPSVAAALNKEEAIIQAEHPTMPKDQVLADSYMKLAKIWDVKAHQQDAKALGEAYGNFSAFPDTVEAVQKLGNHYKLIPISNCTEKQIAEIQKGALKDIDFDAVLTAETVGSYKPDFGIFEHLFRELDDMGIQKEQLLIVAQGVASDHGPALQLGISSAWISRYRPDSEKGYEGIGEENEGKVSFGWRWNSLGDMAKDVEEAFRAESS